MQWSWAFNLICEVLNLSVTCVIVSLETMLWRVLGYTNDQQLHQWCHLMTVGIRV